MVLYKRGTPERGTSMKNMISVIKYIVTHQDEHTISGISMCSHITKKFVKAILDPAYSVNIKKGAIFIERIWIEKRNGNIIECREIKFTGDYYIPDMTVVDSLDTDSNIDILSHIFDSDEMDLLDSKNLRSLDDERGK